MSAHIAISRRFIACCMALAAMTLSTVHGAKDSSGTNDQGEARRIEVIGKEYKFIPDHFSVEAGEKVAVVFKNEGQIAHDFRIKELDMATDPIQRGEEVGYTFTAPKEPGTLHFECTVAGHPEAGMVGTIEVTNRSSHHTPGEEAMVTVEGRVVLEGDQPAPYKRKLVSIWKQHCGMEGDVLKVQHVEVDEQSDGVADVLVWAEGTTGNRPAWRPPEKIVIDQEGCRFIPNAAVLRTGGEVKVLNSDPAVHNFFYQPKDDANPTRGNLMQPPEKGPLFVTFPNEGSYRYRCNVHPWMSGLLLVTDRHPYAVTDAEGRFTLQLPPGERELRVRHYSQEKATRTTLEVPASGLDKPVSIPLSFEEGEAY